MELSLELNYPKMRDRGLEAFHIVSREAAEEPTSVQAIRH
jgi:hypothetical protein